MTDRQLADKMAEALEAICKGASPARGIQAGSPQFMCFEINGRLLDDAQEALAAFREARETNHIPDAGKKVADLFVDANKKPQNHPTPTTPCTPSSQDPN